MGFELHKDDSSDQVLESAHDDISAAIASSSHVPRIRTVDTILVTLAAILAIAAIALLFYFIDANARSEAIHDRYEECTSAVTDLKEASDYLTTESRMYAATGEVSHLDNYLDELNTVRRRDEAVETLRSESNDEQAAKRLVEALEKSNALAELELYAMRLTADSTGVSPLPQELKDVVLKPEDAALTDDEKFVRSQKMLTGSEYDALKSLIVSDVAGSTDELIAKLQADETDIEHSLDRLLVALIVIVCLLVAIVAFAAAANFVLVIRPMRIHAKNIQENEPLEMSGSRELRYVVAAYNQIYVENHRRTLLLKREAETDALTNLLNRGSYDKLLKHHGQNIALVIIDVDLFKQVNDTYGHEVGDEVLKKVANATNNAFRATDYACRIGGDEFAVIMTEMNPEQRDIVSSKLEGIMAAVANTEDGLPAVTISAGVAFSALLPDDGQNIYHAADKALYEAKRRGRNGYWFYGLDSSDQ